MSRKKQDKIGCRSRYSVFSHS